MTELFTPPRRAKIARPAISVVLAVSYARHVLAALSAHPGLPRALAVQLASMLRLPTTIMTTTADRVSQAAMLSP